MWIDYLKVLAILGVLGIHCSSILLDNKYFFSNAWIESVVCSSLFRFAIILFVMASDSFKNFVDLKFFDEN